MTEPSDAATAATAARFEALRDESNLVLAEVSQGQQMAATNLLEKAAVALHQGDRDKARAMVLRAQALGHDEHEDVDVCSWSAHMTMFNLVTDVLDDERRRVGLAGRGRDGAAAPCRKPVARSWSTCW